MNTSLSRFLIVGCARSGTTVLDEAITGHPEVSSVGDEIRVEPLFSKGLSAFTYNHEPADETERGWRILFDAIAGINRADATRAIGFKIAIHRSQEASWVVQNAKRIDPDLRIIFVHRKDLVAQYGSLLRAAQSGVWHSWNKGDRDPLNTIDPDISAFGRYAAECVDIIKQLRSLKNDLPFVEVSYEEQIIPHLQGCISDLFDFIDVSPCQVNWMTSKKVAPAPEHYIKKYSELIEEAARIRNGESPLPWSFQMRLRFFKIRTLEWRRKTMELFCSNSIDSHPKA